MVAKVMCVAPVGFNGSIVEVESDAKRGLPSLQIVGMGSKAIDEAKERVRSAITNSLLEFPASKITINLAPAEIPKDGTHYDLSIALSILCVSKQLSQKQTDDSVFIGELALDGTIRPVRGVINFVETARSNGYRQIVLPFQNLAQARLVSGIDLIPVHNLKELFLHLKGEQLIQPPEKVGHSQHINESVTGSLDDIVGQEQAKRALVIAVAGRHNILMNGPPGSGKTLLAKTLLSLLPPLSPEEQIATTKLYSLAGEATDTVITQRPFRAPHHSASRSALIGGGTKPRPGEISLAHNGVLFMDELPEYPRTVLEALRQPLEDRLVSVSRAAGKVTYPADFMLVGTMNPCPCGYYGDVTRECSCGQKEILLYQKRLSGPLLDRIDLTLTVPKIAIDKFLHDKNVAKKQQYNAKKSIEYAHEMQNNRFNSCYKYNSSLSSKHIAHTTNLSSTAETLLNHACSKLSLSARAYFKIIKVARTIADIEHSTNIQPEHVSEALQYRQPLT